MREAQETYATSPQTEWERKLGTGPLNYTITLHNYISIAKIAHTIAISYKTTIKSACLLINSLFLTK